MGFEFGRGGEHRALDGSQIERLDREVQLGLGLGGRDHAIEVTLERHGADQNARCHASHRRTHRPRAAGDEG